MNPKALFELLKGAYNDWSEDKAPRLGASLAYYTVFSLAPLLLIVITIAGLVFGQEAVQGQIVAQIGGLVGDEGAEAIQQMIVGASKPRTGAIATGIGIATLLFGASGVFGALHDALNTIWEVEPKPGRGVLGMIKDRFLSFTMVLGVGFLLLVALVVSAGLAALGELMRGLLPVPEWVLHVVNVIVAFGITTLLFALIYKILPDVEIRWSDVWTGAAFTALLFTIGKFLLGLYLGKGAVGSAYGVAGSLIVILLWIYYSAQILFFGAEFTQVYANKYGSRVVPTEDAVPVTEEARAQQGMPGEASGVVAAQARPAGGPAASAVGTTSGAIAAMRPSSTQPEQQRAYTYGLAAGAAWLIFIAGLFVGGVGSIVSVLVGMVRAFRR